MLGRTNILDRKVINFAKHIREVVHNERKLNRNAKHSIFDYPSAASVCGYGGYLATGQSKASRLKCYKHSINFETQLENALLNFCIQRHLPVKGLPCKYLNNSRPIYVGTCAEDDAANNLIANLKKMRGIITPLQKLNFSKTIRPRTGQKIDYCQTCKTIFGL